MCIHVHSLIGGSTWQPCLQSLHLIGPAGSCSTKAPSLQAHLGWNNKAFPHFPSPHCPPCIYSKAVFTSALKICNSPAAGKRVYHLALCPENKMLQKVIKKVSWGRKEKNNNNSSLSRLIEWKVNFHHMLSLCESCTPLNTWRGQLVGEWADCSSETVCGDSVPTRDEQMECTPTMYRAQAFVGYRGVKAGRMLSESFWSLWVKGCQ